MLTISDLDEKQLITLQKGRYNIIGCGIRTGKTFWATHSLLKYTRDNQNSRILYLTNTTALRDQICAQYADRTIVGDDLWKESVDAWGEHANKIGVMCYQTLSACIMKKRMNWLDNIDVIVWDECDDIFSFAAQEFAKARKRMSRADASVVLHIVQNYSTDADYTSLILLSNWNRFVAEGRILCVGLSATPEKAFQYYTDIVAQSIKGSYQTGFRARGDIFFYDIMALISTFTPEPTKGYWCYSPWIENNKAIVEAAKQRGFHAIELHSRNNEDKPLDAEQRRVFDCIVNTGMVPPEYDFVVFNNAALRGLNLLDTRFDTEIIDSLLRESREQAGRQCFPYQRYLKVYIPKVPEQYYNRFLTLQECRELAEKMQVRETVDTDRSHSGHIVTWNRLKTLLPQAGYEIENKPQYVHGVRKVMYRITGNWQYAEATDEPFMKLVEAKGGDAAAVPPTGNCDVSYDSPVTISPEHQHIMWTR